MAVVAVRQTLATRVVLAIAVTIGLGGALVLAAGAFAALPALLAFLPLFAGRYVGAARLEALIDRRRNVASRRHSTVARPQAAEPRFRARGGRLIAGALAKRPPPALAAAS
jgi:hypothetical protein